MSNHIDIRFPEDQQEGTEAVVSRWLVKQGDSVAAHEPLVEIETDKVVVEIAAPQAGVIATINIQQDEDVSPGGVLCTLNTDANTVVATLFELEFEMKCEIAVFLCRDEMFGSLLAHEDFVFDNVALGVASPAGKVVAIE